MVKWSKRSLVILLAIMFLLVPVVTGALAASEVDIERADPSAGAMFYDLFFMRPIGALATAGGSIVFVLGLPFSAIGGNVDKSGEKLVEATFRYTLVRPLGNF